MANLPESSSRVYYTAPEVPSGAHIANSWPTHYYLDIGHGEEITGLLPHGEVLLVFTRRSIYMISGDGVGGQWNVDQVVNNVGAMPYCTTVGDGIIYFMNEGGIYALANGSPVKISHPAIQDLWRDYGENGRADSHSFLFLACGAVSVPRKKRSTHCLTSPRLAWKCSSSQVAASAEIRGFPVT